MKNRLRLAAATSVVAICGMALTAHSQPRAQPGAQPRTNQPSRSETTVSSAVSVPGARIALINTESFLDEKQGISRLVAAVADVEREFGPRRTELQQMQTRIKAIADDIVKTQNGADRNALLSKQQQGEALQREYKFKGDEAQAAYQKRVQERTSPINEDIGKALDAFAKQRGITLILDASKLSQIGAILTASDSMDITRAFIIEYNGRGPAGPSK